MIMCLWNFKSLGYPKSFHWFIGLIVIFGYCLVLTEQASCPKVCRCNWRDGKQTVTCNNAKFIDIPRGLDPSIQVLDLQNNNLKILPRFAFKDAELVNLQKVWLTYCKLKQLHRGSFSGLANLVELDLDSNFLRTIPSEALSDVGSLRVLKLARNNLNALPAKVFIPTPNLVRLDLSYNNITAIDDLAFKPLSRLEVLKLTGNKLTIISVKVLVPLVALHDFHVDANPWHCDCLLRPLRQWMLDRNIAASIPPTCKIPPRLNGRKWHTLELDEFVCAPHVTAVAQRVLASDGDNVSLACRVRTDFDARVTWLVGDEPVTNTTQITVLELVAPDDATRLSNLKISRAALQDEGIYRCIAENKAGRAETNLTLQVSKKIMDPQRVMPDQVFVAGALLGTLIFVLFAITIACLLYYRRKKQRLRRHNPIILNMDKEPVTPQISGPRRSISPSDSNRKMVDYHIVPTSEIENENPIEDDKERAWMLRDSSVDDFALSKNTEANFYSKSSSNKLNVISDNEKTTTKSKPVSYVEIPKPSSILTNHEQFEDPLLKDLAYQCKEAVLRRENARPSSIQTSSTNSAHPYPDLLEFPRNQQQQQKMSPQPTQQEMNQFSYCTIPRGPKGRRQTVGSLGNGAGQNTGYSDNTSATTRDRAETSFSLSPGNPFSFPPSETARQPTPYYTTYQPYNGSSSALNLTTMSYSTRNPSLPNTPILPRQALQEFFNTHRPEYVGDESLGAVGGYSYNYEYHAAQLEHFLQEYKCLQEQLFRMKQSCDSARAENNPSKITQRISESTIESQNRPAGATSLPGPSTNATNQRISSHDMPSEAINEPLRSILKNRRGSTGRVQGPISQYANLANDPTQRLLKSNLGHKSDYYYDS